MVAAHPVGVVLRGQAEGHVHRQADSQVLGRAVHDVELGQDGRDGGIWMTGSPGDRAQGSTRHGSHVEAQAREVRGARPGGIVDLGAQTDVGAAEGELHAVVLGHHSGIEVEGGEIPPTGADARKGVAQGKGALLTQLEAAGLGLGGEGSARDQGQGGEGETGTMAHRGMAPVPVSRG